MSEGGSTESVFGTRQDMNKVHLSWRGIAHTGSVLQTMSVGQKPLYDVSARPRYLACIYLGEYS